MSETTKKKPIRVWCDGCFDLYHMGHANMLRRARELGDVLVVGVHSDADISKNKGPPVMHEKERYAAVRACKWADEVVEGSPWVPSVEMLDKYNCDFIVHGDDIVVDTEGGDCYREVRAAGRFRTIPRTKGVSTTNIVGRMLLMTKEHFQTTSDVTKRPSMSPKPVTKLVRSRSGDSDQPNSEEEEDDNESSATDAKSNELTTPQTPEKKKSKKRSPYTSGGSGSFMASTQSIRQFASGSRLATPEDKVVYVEGAFDLFHTGHIELLRQAKEHGTFLVVGVHDDGVVNKHRGANYPIMNLHERVLCVLQCKYVDDVIIGAPWRITTEMVNHLNISVVIRGSASDTDYWPEEGSEDDPYKVVRDLNLLRTLPSSENPLTTEGIIQRVIEHRMRYVKRNAAKEARELDSIERFAKDE